MTLQSKYFPTKVASRNGHSQLCEDINWHILITAQGLESGKSDAKIAAPSLLQLLERKTW